MYHLILVKLCLQIDSQKQNSGSKGKCIYNFCQYLQIPFSRVTAFCIPFSNANGSYYFSTAMLT